MSHRLRAGLAARRLPAPRSIASGALACAAAFAVLPGTAAAAYTDLEVVVTRAKAVARPLPNVASFAIKNAGPDAYDPATAGLVGGHTFVSFRIAGRGTYTGALRSNPGWSCSAAGVFGECSLDHVIPAGGTSLPVELEVIPAPLYETATTELTSSVAFEAGLLLPPVGDEFPAFANLPVTIPAGLGGTTGDDSLRVDWTAAGGTHDRAPAVVGEAANAVLEGDATTAVGFSITSADQISTGPYAEWDRRIEAAPPRGRSWSGDADDFPPVQIALDVPAGAELVGPVRWFQPLPENSSVLLSAIGRAGRSALDPAAQFGEVPFEVGTDQPGQYTATFPVGTRFLPDTPVRIVATVKLASGTDAVTITAEASAPGQVARPLEAVRGRAVLADPAAARASVTLTRKAAPVDPGPGTPAPTTPTTPSGPGTPSTPSTPAATNPAPGTPAPAAGALPEPDRGGVLGERAAPKLVGRIVFKKRVIRVGKQTSLDVTITNQGNAGSDAGRVCVRLSSAIVVVKVPKGVTSKGAVLCASRSALAQSGSLLAIKGVVVRGVTATPSATARDGANDGVELTADRLAIRQAASRPGGVTG